MAIYKMTIMDKLKLKLCNYFCNFNDLKKEKEEKNNEYNIILIDENNIEKITQTLNIDKKIIEEMVLKCHIHYKIIDISFDLFENIFNDDEKNWLFYKKSIDTRDNFMIFYNIEDNYVPQILILYKNINNDFKLFYDFIEKNYADNFEKLVEKFELFLKINNKNNLISKRKSKISKYIGIVLYNNKDIRKFEFEYNDKELKQLFVQNSKIPKNIYEGEFERYITSFEFADKFYIYHNKILEDSFIIIFKDYMINDVKSCLKSCLNNDYHNSITKNKAFVYFKDNVNVLYNYINFMIKNKE